MVGVNYWSNQGVPNANNTVIKENTPGDQQPDALENIPGSALGARPVDYVTGAQAIYPLFPTQRPDGTWAPPPASTLDYSKFTEWHSASQIEYIADNGDQSFSVGGQRVSYYTLIENNTRVINLDQMSLADYASLKPADKALIDSKLLSLGIAERLGLTSSRAAVDAAISNARTAINNASANMTETDRNVFRGQLTLIENKINAGGLINSDRISSDVAEIVDRFTRANAFVGVRQSATFSILWVRDEGGEYRGTMTGIQAQTNAISSDNNATIGRGYAELMRAERDILTQQKRRDAISINTTLRNPRDDVANLIYQLQMLYEAESGAIADSGTEIIRQLHKLLEDYGVMQRLINDTIKEFDPSEADQKRRFMNLGGLDNGGVENDQHSNDGGNHDTRITYQTSQGSFTSTGGDGRNNAYNDSPGYHWFRLQATTPSGTISGAPFNGDSLASHYARDDGKQNGGLSESEMRIFSMFSDDTFARQSSTRQLHPIESYFDLPERPTQKFTDESNEGDGSLKLMFKSTFDAFATQLNDTVTLLNQKNQLKQNEIENATRTQNRHFDLGNNALRKMNDLLMSIGRM